MLQLDVVLDGTLTVCPEPGAHWGSVVLRDAAIGEAVRTGVRVASAHFPDVSGSLSGTRIVRDSRLFAAALRSIVWRDRVTLADVLQRVVTSRIHTHPLEIPSWLHEARALLHEHYCDPVKFFDLAARVHRHHVHLSRMFSHAFGKTMSAYVRDLRLARACELLLTTDGLLSRIALATGFADHAHFTRIFVAKTGITPSSYRQGAAMTLVQALPTHRESGLHGNSYADRRGRGRIALATA